MLNIEATLLDCDCIFLTTTTTIMEIELKSRYCHIVCWRVCSLYTVWQAASWQ